MSKNTDFRRWLHELWLRNCDERAEYGERRYTQEQYFQQYKYWLKREFKYQRSQNAQLVW
jgi:hypothetical protein